MINFESLVEEFKEDFQIPPFISFETLKNYAQEGYQFLKSKKDEDFDINVDHSARALLKEYMNYAYFKKRNEFEDAFQSAIYSWLMEPSK